MKHEQTRHRWINGLSAIKKESFVCTFNILCTRNNPVTEDTIDLFFLKNKRIKSNNNYLDKEHNGNRDRTKKFGFIGPYLGWWYPPALKSARDNESLACSYKRIHALRPTINCIILDPGHSMHPTATSKGRIRSRETIDNAIISNASLRV